MIDVEKHIAYWRIGAEEDWQVATDLALSEEQRVFLARFDRYQIEGRYPTLLPPAPDIETARQELEQAKEVFEWLSHQLQR